MTYGWAILVILVVVSGLFALGVFDSDTVGSAGAEGPFSYEAQIGEGAVSIVLTGAGIDTATVESIEVGTTNCVLPVDNTLKGGEQKTIRCLDANIDPDTNNEVKVTLDYSRIQSSLTHNLEINTQPGKEQIRNIGDFYLDDTDLMGYWKLDNDANDASDNNNDGTASSNSFVSGKINEASNFNGIDSYIHVPTFTSGTISYSYWIKFNSLGPQTLLSPCSRIDCSFATGTHRRGTSRLLDTNIISTYRQSYIDGCSPQSTSITSNKNDFQTGTWYHIVETWDSQDLDIVKLYIDGNLDNSVAVSYSCRWDVSHLFLGKGSLSDGQLNGDMDEIMIFNKVLSEQEISVIYENTK